SGARAPESATGSDLPTRDELTLAWGDTVLSSLPGNVKARYAGGRFVEVSGGAAVFALPNAMHRDRCEDVRAQAEAALATHFGRAVPLRLTVEPSSGPPRPQPAVAPPPPDDPVDPAELTDAPATPAPSAVDRLAEAFPGAELLEEP
ncbi:MAG: hypothetical protein ACRD0G_09855, partial [Acidimicrobiales bacterium]